MNKSTPFSDVFKLSRHAKMLESIKGLLSWDQETYMPSADIDLRSEQTAFMAGLVHKELTSKKFQGALSKLIDLKSGALIDESLSPAEAACAREWRRDYLRDAKLPSSFVRRFAQTTATAQAAWKNAKEKNRFKLFAPHLEKIVSLVRKKADYLGFEAHPYDALVDLYEPEMKTATLTTLFGTLQGGLSSLVKKIQDAPPPDVAFLHKPYPPERQLKYGKFLLKAMGFVPETSRVDPTAHPFCLTLSPKDIRLTTWIHPEYLPTHLFAILHEGGHGLYEHNLPEEYFGSPLCDGASLGIHESQSRFYEEFIGHSLPFWKHFYPHLQKEFPEELQGIYLEDFYKAINIVRPSLIRVEADEVTYCLHVILRFEIEKALLEGHLKVRDIPEVWNEKMRTYLGITPPSDALGALQDVHWSLGAFGYFPTYALGNLYAASLFSTLGKEHPHWKEELGKGNLSLITTYLKEKVHKWGRQYTPEQLIQRATGSPLSATPFLDYLNQKFATLYHF